MMKIFMIVVIVVAVIEGQVDVLDRDGCSGKPHGMK